MSASEGNSDPARLSLEQIGPLGIVVDQADTVFVCVAPSTPIVAHRFQGFALLVVHGGELLGCEFDYFWRSAIEVAESNPARSNAEIGDARPHSAGLTVRPRREVRPLDTLELNSGW